MSENLWSYIKKPTQSSLLQGIVFLSFLLTLLIQAVPLDKLIFGSVRDTSIHSLFVQVVLENKQVPVTLAPYLPEGIVYPQAFSAIAAFSVYISNFSPPQAVFYLTVLFSAMSVFGAYYLGKALSGNVKLAFCLAFVFAFFSTWPKYITWGSNALVAGLPLYLLCLSFLPSLFESGKKNFKELLVVSILFGYLGVIHLQLYELLMVSVALFLVSNFRRFRRELVTNFLMMLLVFAVSLIPLAPFLYRAIVFYPYPYHNIGLPLDINIPSSDLQLSRLLDGFVWTYEHIATGDILRAYSLLLFIAASVGVFVRINRSEKKGEDKVAIIAAFTFAAQLILLAAGTVSPENLPFYPQPLTLYVSAYILLGVFNMRFYRGAVSFFSKLRLASINKSRAKGFLAVALVFSAIYAPYVYTDFSYDPSNLTGSYMVFSVTTKDDLELMLWIRNNLSQNATILVNAFEPGTFIPSISYRKVVYPPTASSYSSTYQRLNDLIEAKIINATVYDLMRQLKVTHVYVGSRVGGIGYGWHKWNSTIFLGSDGFSLIKRIGDASLFVLKRT